MKKVLGLSLLALALTTTGCATMELMKEPTDYQSAYSRVTFTTDQYQGTRTYKSTAITLKDIKWGDTDFLMGQLSLTKKGDQESYCLLTLYNGENWSFFEKAFDINQNELPLIKGNRRVGTMGNDVHINEQSCISLRKDYLIKAANDGLDIKMVGQNKNMVIKVQPFFIKSFLDAVDYSERTRFTSQ